MTQDYSRWGRFAETAEEAADFGDDAGWTDEGADSTSDGDTDAWDNSEPPTAGAQHETEYADRVETEDGDEDTAGNEAGDEVAGTGHPAVDAAVRAVANAATLPVAEQLAAYEGAHETLREVLASIED